MTKLPELTDQEFQELVLLLQSPEALVLSKLLVDKMAWNCRPLEAHMYMLNPPGSLVVAHKESIIEDYMKSSYPHTSEAAVPDLPTQAHPLESAQSHSVDPLDGYCEDCGASLRDCGVWSVLPPAPQTPRS